ncbi:hypothetical protein GH5_07687 [Leishmania sp. Ghana 2012 LV757]|uniref:hypothetical protein n=1 Tax=Leishmania sp. Ghana 2012 LV757 TaxID=2803181 RepID=UPI001B512022|nr:hypothetical protein GH5_07687 [Leishmania sp. Ghana 2012 LV757]
MKDEKEQAIELLREFGATATPKFVDSGEALIYLAYKDEVLEKVITLLNSALVEPISNGIQRLRVNHEQLAKAVIERTFDAHTQVLRSKLAAVEKAADMWKKVALFGGGAKGSYASHTASTKLSFCIPERVSVGIQACSVAEEAAESESGTSVQQCSLISEEVKEWFGGWTAKILGMVDEKIELWCSLQPCLAVPMDVSQYEREDECSGFDDRAKAVVSRNSTRHAPRKMNSAMMRGNLSRKVSGKATEGRVLSSSLASGKTPVQITFARSYATPSIVPTPSRPNSDARSPQYAQPGSPLYVMRSISLQARATQPRGKQRASSSGAPKGWTTHLPQM